MRAAQTYTIVISTITPQKMISIFLTKVYLSNSHRKKKATPGVGRHFGIRRYRETPTPPFIW
jgi:hypothetical protein